MNSPVLKSFGDKRIADGERCLVADLSACAGMDSTFMGTLGGLARRISLHGGMLQIADPGERNRRSLEDLGLDNLMEIEPATALWNERLPEIRSHLSAPSPISPLSSLQRMSHVLEAHEKLSALSDKNAKAFSEVVGSLRRDINKRLDTDAKPD